MNVFSPALSCDGVLELKQGIMRTGAIAAGIGEAAPPQRDRQTGRRLGQIDHHAVDLVALAPIAQQEPLPVLNGDLVVPRPTAKVAEDLRIERLGRASLPAPTRSWTSGCAASRGSP